MPFLDDFRVATVLQPALEKMSQPVAAKPDGGVLSSLPGFLKADSDGNGKPDFKGLSMLVGAFVLGSVLLGFVMRGKRGAAAAVKAPMGWYKSGRRSYRRAKAYARRGRQSFRGYKRYGR